MAKEAKTVSFNSNTIKTVDDLNCFGGVCDFSYKVDTIINNWVNLLKFTKLELINKFTENEVKLMLDSTNGMMFSTHTSPILVLHSNVADDIALHNTDKLLNVDKDILLEKLLGLTAQQAYVILLLCKEYWNAKDPDSVDIKELFMIRE